MSPEFFSAGMQREKKKPQQQMGANFFELHELPYLAALHLQPFLI
jgi:hypothetical protein